MKRVEMIDVAVVESHLTIDDLNAAEGKEDTTLKHACTRGVLNTDSGMCIFIFGTFVEKVAWVGMQVFNGQGALDG